jgi:hypothetical protein
MNLADLAVTSARAVFQTLEGWVWYGGGWVTGTEVIGMIPDGLVLSAAEDRLQLLDAGVSRLLSVSVDEHVAARVSRDARGLLDALAREGEAVSSDVKAAAERLSGSLGAETPIPSSKS